MGISITTLALAKKFVTQSLNGVGAIKGAPCRIKDIVKGELSNVVTFEWKGTDDSTYTSVMEVENGVSPVITENKDNSEDVYKLDIQTKDGTFTTPNLMQGSAVQVIEF